MEETLGQGAAFDLTVRRNSSLSVSARQFAFALPLLVLLVIAIVFTAMGAWLILPFAGAELAVLWWAFRACARHASDFERITIAGDIVTVEIGEGGATRRVEMNRWWVRVVSDEGSKCLALRSHGRQVAIGRNMNECQRQRLAGVLGKQLNPIR